MAGWASSTRLAPRKAGTADRDQVREVTGYNCRLPPEVRHSVRQVATAMLQDFRKPTPLTVRGEVDFVTMEFLDSGDARGAAETRDGARERGALDRPAAVPWTGGKPTAAGTGNTTEERTHPGPGRGRCARLRISDGALPGNRLAVGAIRRRGATPDYMAPELRKGEKATVASGSHALA